MSAVVATVKTITLPGHRRLHPWIAPLHEKPLQTSGVPCSPLRLSAPRIADRHSYIIPSAIYGSSAFLEYAAQFLVRLSSAMLFTATSTYFLPAILLNPVLFLHSLNTILSRILPPVITTAAIQPLPYYNLGPSANHPHLNCHASDSLCWGYTILIVSAQLLVFGRISQSRTEVKERSKSNDTATLASTWNCGRREEYLESFEVVVGATKSDGITSKHKEDPEWWED